MRIKTVLLILLVGASTVPLRPAAQDSGSPRFTSSVNLVKVPISIFDSRGLMVDAIRQENFRIWEDQAPQEIRSFGIDANSVSVVLVLDTSGSTEAELKKIKAAAEEFAESLDPGDRISLLTFDDQVYLALDWTDNKKKVKKALAKLKPGLRTSLYDAMFLAATEQLKDIDGRKAIILLTDCLNNQSGVSFHEAELAVTQSQASFYVVSKTVMVREDAKRQRRVVMLTDIYKRLFGEDQDYIDEFFEKREAEMSGLAEETGGRCFFPTDYDQIKDVYMDVARELKSKYYLTYISNQHLLPNSYHRIAVEYLGPADKVIYRKGYYHLPQPLYKARPLGASNRSFERKR